MSGGFLFRSELPNFIILNDTGYLKRNLKTTKNLRKCQSKRGPLTFCSFLDAKGRNFDFRACDLDRILLALSLSLCGSSEKGFLNMQKQHDRDVGGGDYLVDRIPERKADPRVHSIIFFSESYHGIGFFS